MTVSNKSINKHKEKNFTIVASVSQEELRGKLDFAVSRIYQDGNLITRIETEEIKPELPSGKAESIVYYIARIEFEKKRVNK
ncbi:MAG TPA: hypothetical protein VI278_05845 [Nitrososphaeraceae archaeon]